MFRKLIIRFVTPYIWKLSPARKAKALSEFSAIEKDSGNQILYTLQFVRDAELKAHIFQHVLEEYFHADLFKSLSKQYSENRMIAEVFTKESWLSNDSTPEEVADFFSYAHVGEDSVNRDFGYYVGVKGLDPKISAIFKKVSEDEGTHILGTSDILLKMVNRDVFKFRWLIIKSHLKRFRKQTAKTFNDFMMVLLTLCIGLVYFLIGGLVHRVVSVNFFKVKSEDVVFLMREKQKEISKI